jgi:hypothetical protein
MTFLMTIMMPNTMTCKANRLDKALAAAAHAVSHGQSSWNVLPENIQPPGA